MMNTEQHSRFEWLLSPWLILASIVGAIFFALYFPTQASHLKLIGDIFIKLLTVCVLPLVAASFIGGVAKLIRHKHTGVNLKRLICIALSSLVIVTLTTMVVAWIANFPKLLQGEVTNHIGKLMLDAAPVSANNVGGVHALFLSLFTDNIFASFAERHYLSIIVFSVLFGMALGRGRAESVEGFIQWTDVVFETCLRFVNGVCYLLPIGLFALFSYQIAHVGTHLIRLLLSYILWFYGCGILIFAALIAMIAFRLKISILAVLNTFRRPLILAFFTCSGFAALPFILDKLENHFGFSKDVTNVVMPLSIFFQPLGSILFDGFALMFMVALYGKALSLSVLLVIFFGCIASAIAMNGVPAIAALSMLAIALTPLQIPVQTAVILFIAIANIVDPIATLVNVSGNLMLGVLTIPQKG